MICGLLSDLSVAQASCGGAHTVVVTGITPATRFIPGAVAQSCFTADSGVAFSMGLNEDGQLGHSSKTQFVPVGILRHPVRTVISGAGLLACW